jgi:hypothetical protein
MASLMPLQVSAVGLAGIKVTLQQRQLLSNVFLVSPAPQCYCLADRSSFLVRNLHGLSARKQNKAEQLLMYIKYETEPHNIGDCESVLAALI